MLLKFFRTILIVALFTIAGYFPVLYFNICEDPFGVFSSTLDHQKIEPSNHFIKMRFLLNNPDQFDSFIFGSSRANNLDPMLFNNGKYYNLYYSLGVPFEHLEDIQMLLRNKVHIKNILLLLDNVSYTTSVENRDHDMLRNHYTDNKIKLAQKYIRYIFPVPDERFKNEYDASNQKVIYNTIFQSGRAFNAEADSFIEHHKEEHIKDPKFNNPTLTYASRLLETISDINTIKEICDANKINLRLVINPIHHTTYLSCDKELFFLFLKKLSAISGFYDFSGLNKVTMNNYFYYETSHFRPIIGNAMADYIQFGKNPDTIPNFGTYITAENINNRIKQLRDQLKK